MSWIYFHVSREKGRKVAKVRKTIKRRMFFIITELYRVAFQPFSQAIWKEMKSEHSRWIYLIEIQIENRLTAASEIKWKEMEGNGNNWK